MQKILEKLKEIENGKVGMMIYSPLKQEIELSHNSELTVPLASAAKVGIGFCVVKFIEEGYFNWNDVVDNMVFNPDEDSNELYPHFQSRKSLALRDAVEVMITCHDSLVANSIVEYCGGWEKINTKIKERFDHITLTQNPRDKDNNGEICQLLELLCFIFEGYRNNPDLWLPLINGLVRQQGSIEGVPNHFLNHMTGGLENVVVDIGIIGDFGQNPLLYVLGAKDLPDRQTEKWADEKIIDALKLLYHEYLVQKAVTAHC